jgi:hypothetical protein
MSWARGIVLVLGALLGLWLGFDGARALMVGDYVTPGSGAHAGELGPWSRLVAALGIEPRSPAMKIAHVALGGLWLAAVAGFAARLPGSRWGVLGCAVASLWYLPFGTVIGLIEIALILLLPSVGRAA